MDQAETFRKIPGPRDEWITGKKKRRTEMAKFNIVVTWTQELSVEKEVEATSLEEATRMALAIDPNEDVDEHLNWGDVVSDIEAMVDGETVGMNNCPFDGE
jgi:hypothetical protein